MRKRLIVNADDFGRNVENTNATIIVHKYGILSSTTVMVKKRAFDLACKLIKENPTLKTGLHIDLDFIFIMKEPDRFYKKLVKITKSMKIKIKDEINKQLDKFLKAGFSLTHLDSHHHSHMHPDVLPIVAAKAKELNVPIRFYNGYYSKSKFFYKNLEKEVLIPILKHFNVKYPYFLKNQFNLDLDYEVGEVMMHPGFNELWRTFDIAKCLDPELKKRIEEKNIEIISFADLK
ncbi:MAG: ChbG/HpnK family deacetylase [Endomicrobium sp.]|jgi:predicted glycoside hydrolase/deacetylase ChbG (UPF0249 family)|nr:ChbG/HpnK family deacetylase [Endomicrobium sp.]